MPRSISDEETKDKTGSPSAEVDIVEDDDDGSVEVTEDGSPAQDATATSDADDDDQSEDDGDGDDGTETDDKATLERKRKKAAQREASKFKRQLAAAEARQEALEREMAELRAERLERAKGSVAQRVTAAEQALKSAYEDGDADSIVTAQRALREAETEAEEWKRKESRPAPRASAPANPLVEQFVAKHDAWFDPAGKDVDSSIVIKLSETIASEGIRPDTPQHFAELDRRMKRYLPHRVGASKPKPKATAAAPSGGGSNGASAAPGSISIPKATIKGFKEVGLDWDDPDIEARKAARAKIIQRVQETRRSRGETA